MGKRLALAAALFITVACSGDKPATAPTPATSSTPPVTTSQPPTDPTDSPTADPFEVKPAPAVHQDRYAGFQLSIPKGWFHFSISGVYSFAPSKSRLAAHPEVGDWADAETYTVLVMAHQDQTFAESVERARNSNSESGTWTERAGTTGGRPSRRLLHREPPNDRSSCACVDEYTVIQWSQETVLSIDVHAGSDAAFKQFRSESAKLTSSLRSGPVDARAGALRDFLSARIARKGAERWLTKESAAVYRTYGLYDVIDGSDLLDVYDYNVEAVTAKDRTTFDVAVWGKSSSGVLGARTERIIIGLGRDAAGDRHRDLVLEMIELQAPGTS